MLAGAACGAPAGLAPTPAAGCCRVLTYVYEASIFKIDVMRLHLRVDSATAAAVEALIDGASRSDDLERRVAERYLAARELAVDTEFVMAMSGDTFIDNAIGTLRGLARDGQLTAAAADTLARAARARFDFLRDRGVRRADRIEYHVSADTVTTRYFRADSLLLHDRQVGPTHRVAVLGSYFAPSSDFRRGLLDRVFAR